MSKSEVIKVRVTPTQMRNVKRMARHAKVSVAVFIRWILAAEHAALVKQKELS